MHNKTENIHASYKDFCLMVVGQIISILGSALLRFALSLYVLDITGRADVYAAIYAISNIPLLISPIGGAIADRFHKRNLMVLFDFTSGFIIFLYCLCLSYGNNSVILTGFIMVLLSTISSMYAPAVISSIPLLVEENKLEAANGCVNGVQAISNVAAPIIGGILYGIFGVNIVVFVSSIAFFCSAVLELLIHIPFCKREYTGNVFSMLVTDTKTGFLYVLKKTVIKKTVILAVLINLILTPFFIIGIPIILKVAMQSTDIMYGIGMGVINSATILGALFVGIITKKMNMKNLYRWFLSISIFMIPIAVSVAPVWNKSNFYPSYLLFLFFAVPVAMIMTSISIFIITKVQKETPNENLGKVMAIITAISQCAAPVGQIIYGFIFQTFQTSLYIPALFICIAMILISIIAKKILKNEETGVC